VDEKKRGEGGEWRLWRTRDRVYYFTRKTVFYEISNLLKKEKKKGKDKGFPLFDPHLRCQGDKKNSEIPQEKKNSDSDRKKRQFFSSRQKKEEKKGFPPPPPPHPP